MTDQARSPWDFIQPWDIEYFGDELKDETERSRWETAFAIAGGLPYIWQVIARPLSDIIYGLLEPKAGDRILIIGEGVEPAGWRSHLLELVGSSGAVDVVEIIRDGRKAVHEKRRGRNGKLGCWQWTYTNGIADGAYDCVAVLQSTQHCDDWHETMAELLRVMKSGRRIVFAEAVLNGKHFRERINSDVHVRQWYDKMFPARLNFDEVSYYSGEDILALGGALLERPQCLEWRGIEMVWGRKP
jgi:SAM-dependent methyltransferase